MRDRFVNAGAVPQVWDQDATNFKFKAKFRGSNVPEEKKLQALEDEDDPAP